MKIALFSSVAMKIKLFSSTLFRRPNFVGRPMKIAIFDGFQAIFVCFWSTKLHYFPVVQAIIINKSSNEDENSRNGRDMIL
jgi:hypothetical protein